MLPINAMILIIPAAVLLFGLFYVLFCKPKRPCFSILLLLVTAFFLLCTIVIDAKMNLLSHSDDQLVMLQTQLVDRLAQMILGRGGPERYDEAFSLLRGIVIGSLAATIVSAVLEGARVLRGSPQVK